LKYRGDIDGLRAVAVLSVIWFHYGAPLPPWARLPGGFTGVDVFFVISGFLITQQLYADIRSGRFSLLSFYDRRVRRILPALLFMLAIVLIAGRWFLMPGDYMSLATSAGTATFGASNFYFLFNTGYFDQSSELMPLLHTWSLGVEEQFYVVWPILLFSLSKFGSRNNLAALTATIVLIGFGAMIVWIGLDPKAAFYMAAPRAWELAIGALLVFLPPLNRFSGSLAVPTGLALVAMGFFVADAHAFPGPSAILPCAGSALVIWPRVLDNRSSKWLGTLRPVGLISYSLYLWHWPIWVFYRLYINSGVPRIREAAALSVISIIISFLSYRFIEAPFRKSRWAPEQSVRAGLFACMLLFCSAMYVHSSDGIPSRTTAAYAMRSLPVMWKWPCENKHKEIVPGIKASDDLPPFCTFGAPWTDNVEKAVLWGDSNAEHFAPILAESAVKNNISVLLYPLCPPILDGESVIDSYEAIPNYNKVCAERRGAMFSFLRAGSIKTVILSASWIDLAERLAGPDPISAFRNGLLNTVKSLTDMNLSVAIIATVPHWTQDPISCALLSVGLVRRQCDDAERYVSRTQYEIQSHDMIKTLDDVKRRFPNVSIVIPGDALCHGSTCVNRINGEFIYRDSAHLRRNLSPETDRLLAQTLHLDGILKRVGTVSPVANRLH